MWKSKKLILVLVLAVLLVAGGTTGAVLAVDGDGTQAASKKEALLDRALEIYNENSETDINPEQLKDALAQARSEMQAQALQERLQKLADNGLISQKDADALVAWWQTKPDVGPEGPLARGIGLGLLSGAIDSSKLEAILNNLADNGKIDADEAAQLLSWYQSRPDVDLPAPEGKGCGGNAGSSNLEGQVFRGPMMGGKGFGGGSMMGGQYENPKTPVGDFT